MQSTDILEIFKIDIAKGKIHALLHVLEFEDHGSQVVYNQSLGLSAYGSTKEEAHKMFVEIVIPDFCQNLLGEKEDTIFAFLKDKGWIRHEIYDKDLSKASHIDIEGILRNFDLSEDTVVNEDFIAA